MPHSGNGAGYARAFVRNQRRRVAPQKVQAGSEAPSSVAIIRMSRRYDVFARIQRNGMSLPSSARAV